jgi:hypothetical protein
MVNHYCFSMLQTAGDRALTAMGNRITHQGAVYSVTRSIGAPFTLIIRESTVDDGTLYADQCCGSGSGSTCFWASRIRIL